LGEEGGSGGCKAIQIVQCYKSMPVISNPLHACQTLLCSSTVYPVQCELAIARLSADIFHNRRCRCDQVPQCRVQPCCDACCCCTMCSSWCPACLTAFDLDLFTSSCRCFLVVLGRSLIWQCCPLLICATIVARNGS